MSGILTFSTGVSSQFIQVNRSAFTGTSKSNRPMSFTGRSPSRITMQAFTETASTINIKKPAKNLYEILRVKETASPIEIKSAYRSLAKRYHPDASSSDGRDFIEIHNAYSTLSDPTARDRYDISIGLRWQQHINTAGNLRRDFGGQKMRRWETDQCW